MLRFLYLCLFLTIANYVVADDDSSDSDSDSSGSKSSSSESSEEPANVILGDNHQAVRSGIYGGENINVQEAKYQVQIAIGINDFTICGGTIISPTHILTAAHCIHRPIRPDMYTIISGSSYRGKGGHKSKVKSVVVHDGYDTVSFDNDIALITLKSPIKFDATQEAIPITKKKAAKGDKAIVSGFGRESSKLPPSKELKKAILAVQNKDHCDSRYLLVPPHGIHLTDNQFCAGTGSPDTCQGDSGGPVVIDGALAGVVSFGLTCSETTVPGVYTEVYNYRAWIEQHSGLKL